MKKLFPIAIIAVCGVLAFASCTKKTNSSGQYTCSCTFKGSSTGADTTEKSVYPAGLSQATATTDCNAQQTTIQAIDPTGKCSL